MLSSVRPLRVVGIAEGISFLVLLLIAMPLKYFFELPLAVKLVGWAHGVLFIAYIVVVLVSIRVMKWSWFDLVIAFVASLVPGGTLFLDGSWRSRERELTVAASEGGRPIGEIG